MRWAGHEIHMEDIRKAHKHFIGKPEGKRPLVRPRHRWENNNRMGIIEIGWDSVD
jgi:hypothetical protein